MPDVIQCPYCHQEVSAKTVECGKCGTWINEVPNCVTVEVLDSLRDEELPGFLFWYAAKFLEQNGSACYVIGGPPEGAILAKLPRGIRVGYTLCMLISEVGNGGFYQWFTNSSGRIAYETLDDLRLIGAVKYVHVVEQAIRLNERLEAKHPSYKQRWEERPESCCNSERNVEFWADVDASFMPEFDRLSSEIYTLEDTDPVWTPFAKYVREHVHELAHRRE